MCTIERNADMATAHSTRILNENLKFLFSHENSLKYLQFVSLNHLPRIYTFRTIDVQSGLEHFKISEVRLEVGVHSCEIQRIYVSDFIALSVYVRKRMNLKIETFGLE